VQRGLHSSAVAILQELLNETYNEEHVHLYASPLEPVLIGVITAIIHHSDAENFKPLLDVVLEQSISMSSDARYAALSSRLLFVVCSVRMGTRIDDWRPILSAFAQVMGPVNELTELESAAAWDVLSATSVVFQYCALDAAIPHEKLLEGLTKGPWENFFLPFCNMFAELGVARFKTLLLPYFKRCVTCVLPPSHVC
jgi:U3 small nucleolar RNA-associated protein 20